MSAKQMAAVFGINLESRRNIPEELELMGRLVDAMPLEVSMAVVEVFCDSKGCAVYHFQVTREPFSLAIAEWGAAWLRKNAGGYNGVSAGIGRFFGDYQIGPWWNEPDFEEE